MTTNTVRAELVGNDFCSVGDIVARGSTPILSLCRELLAQGMSPDQALTVFRQGALILTVRSISEAARLTVKSASHGPPIFCAHERAAASSVRQSGAAFTSPRVEAAE